MARALTQDPRELPEWLQAEADQWRRRAAGRRWRHFAVAVLASLALVAVFTGIMLAAAALIR